MRCRYCELNDPFCCVYRSTDCQCFFDGLNNSQKLTLPVGDLDPHLIDGSLGAHTNQSPNRVSTGLAVFAGITDVTNRHTDRLCQ